MATINPPDTMTHGSAQAVVHESPLRIALVAPGFSANQHDWCIPALRNLVQQLALRHEVTVYTLRYPHSAGAYELFSARVRAFGGATRTGWRRLPLLSSAIARLLADAQERPFSVIHGLWADEPGFVAAVAGRLCRTPTIISLMGGELIDLAHISYGAQRSRSARFLIRGSISLANMLSAGSQQMVQQAQQHARHASITELPLGVDLSLFRGSAERGYKETLRLLHVASLSPVKDQETLLRAFGLAHQQLKPRPIALYIAGAGPCHKTLRQLANELGIGRVVNFLGELPHHRLPHLLRQGHLFVLSSLHESQSLAALEAAACGLPVVGTSVGVLPQLVAPRYLAPPGDYQALAACIVRALQDDERREQEAKRLQSIVTHRYRLEKTVAAFLSIYRQSLAYAGHRS